jgi:hypothetical protein
VEAFPEEPWVISVVKGILEEMANHLIKKKRKVSIVIGYMCLILRGDIFVI